MPIDYAVVDAEIRPMVAALNALPGVETLFSCASHEETDEAYVTFVAASNRSLREVLTRLPFVGSRVALVANRFEWQTITITAEIDSEGRLTHSLRMGGGPRYMRRALLSTIEDGLKTRPRQLSRGKGPSCSGGAAGRN